MGRKFGFSFSWKRALGISAAKGRLSRAIGIPLTRSGRKQKIGRMLGGGGGGGKPSGGCCGCLVLIVAVLFIVKLLSAVLGDSSASHSTTNADSSTTGKSTSAALATAGAEKNSVSADRSPRVTPSLAPSLAIEQSKQAALRKYPALGVAGSSLNMQFIERYKRYQVEKPEYFQNPSWPMVLVEECAQKQGTR